MFQTYHLTTTGSTTGDNLGPQRNASLLVSQTTAHQIVHRQLDGLLWRNTNQLGQDTRVQAADTFVANNLLEAVDGVLVQALSGLRSTLVLQTGLDKIDGVHHEGTKGTSQTAQTKVVSRLKDLVQDGTALGSDLIDSLAGGVQNVVHGVAP
jgi:hypothetical protein